MLPISRKTDPYWVQEAVKRVHKIYGARIHDNDSALLKFGENPLVGTTAATIMNLPTGVVAETHVSSNLITHISSASGSDTVDIYYEGETISDGVFTEVSGTITLAGQTKTALPTAVARISRAKNVGSSNLVGNVYFYQDGNVTSGVPDTDSEVHLIIDAAENQSMKIADTVPGDQYLLVTHIYASLNKKTASGAVIRLRVRERGGVFQTKFKKGINALGSSLDKVYRPFLIIPANADFHLSAEADSSNTPVSGGIDGLFFKVDES